MNRIPRPRADVRHAPAGFVCPAANRDITKATVFCRPSGTCDKDGCGGLVCAEHGCQRGHGAPQSAALADLADGEW